MTGEALPAGYRVLDPVGIIDLLGTLADVRARLGRDPGAWRIREVGDGNLNLVFIVEGPDGSVCVKQALPYVRAAGPSWPMTPARAFFENAYFRAVEPHVGALIPKVFHYVPELFCMVMERLSPHVILRHGLIEGRRYERAAADVGDYVARACFFTSDFAQPFEKRLPGVALFAGNEALVRITVDLVFTDPYVTSARNRHTTPQLDAAVGQLRRDGSLKAAAARLGRKFLTETQALIHGDLHSGSIMVTATETRVIDPEFAFYGPIGFDLGAFLANLLLNWYAQPGLGGSDGARIAQRRWLLEQAKVFWETFRSRWLALWAEHPGGDAYPSAMFGAPEDAPALAAARARFLDELFADMIGFAACKMIRRITGFAHVADFEGIEDPDRRARCEAGALALARTMLTHPERFRSIDDLLEAARSA